MKCDFHFHSEFSDGSESVDHIFELAAASGVRALALTDHDTVLGIPSEAEASAKYRIPFIPAAEFTAKEDGIKFHVLGFHLNYRSQELIRYSSKLLDYMNERSRRQIAKMQENGIDIPEEAFFRKAGGGPLYRAKLLRTLADAGYIKQEDVMSLLPSYFGKGAPYYEEDGFEYNSFQQTCDLIRRNGGIVVLAHPAKVLKKSEALYQRLIHSQLLDGLEIFHPSNTPEVRQELMEIVRQNHLIDTGGTDFHGLNMKHPIPIGSEAIPDEVSNTLRQYFVAGFN